MQADPAEESLNPCCAGLPPPARTLRPYKYGSITYHRLTQHSTTDSWIVLCAVYCVLCFCACMCLVPRAGAVRVCPPPPPVRVCPPPPPVRVSPPPPPAPAPAGSGTRTPASLAPALLRPSSSNVGSLALGATYAASCAGGGTRASATGIIGLGLHKRCQMVRRKERDPVDRQDPCCRGALLPGARHGAVHLLRLLSHGPRAPTCWRPQDR
jgi:hypothetical protein